MKHQSRTILVQNSANATLASFVSELHECPGLSMVEEHDSANYVDETYFRFLSGNVRVLVSYYEDRSTFIIVLERARQYERKSIVSKLQGILSVLDTPISAVYSSITGFLEERGMQVNAPEDE